MLDNSRSKVLAARALSWLLPFLVLSAAYLYAFPQAKFSTPASFCFMLCAGVIAAILLVPLLIRHLRERNILRAPGWFFVAAGAVLGIILIKTGTSRTEWNGFTLPTLSISLVGSRVSLPADYLEAIANKFSTAANFLSQR